MSILIDVAAVDDLKDGTMKVLTAEGRQVLLARVGDDYYAVDERCPHMGAQLSNSRLEGTLVVCPRHGSRFDLRDGRAVQWTELSGIALRLAKFVRSPRSLRTYPVHIEGDRVLVDLDPSA